MQKSRIDTQHEMTNANTAVSITPQGDVEFEFPSTDDAAFFRIEVE